MNFQELYRTATTPPKEGEIAENTAQKAIDVEAARQQRVTWLGHPVTQEFLKALVIAQETSYTSNLLLISDWETNKGLIQRNLQEQRTIERILTYVRTGKLPSN